MQTKRLYLLVSNSGDGSYSIQYTFDKDLLDRIEKAVDDDELDPEYCPGFDGDGFHYEWLDVPIECTAESMGISVMGEEVFDV